METDAINVITSINGHRFTPFRLTCIHPFRERREIVHKYILTIVYACQVDEVACI